MPTSHIKQDNITDNRFLIILSKLISYIFHPVFMPIIMTIALYYLNPISFTKVDQATFMRWLGTIGVNTIFFPCVTIFLLKKLNFIDSIQLKSSKDRIIPLIATMVFYFWAYMLFKNFKAHTTLNVLFLGNFWGIILLFMFNIFKKVSMHAAAAGGAIGIFIVAMIVSHTSLFIPLIVTIVVAGIIGSARLVLRAHTTGEIGIGYIIGIVSQLAAYVYLAKIV